MADGNGWSEHKIAVNQRFERIEAVQQDHETRLRVTETNVIVSSFKNGAWGFLGGAGTVGLYLLARYFGA